jgi:outer membrane lipoprotein-sorting protein
MNKLTPNTNNIDKCIQQIKSQYISDEAALNINKRIKIAVENEAIKLNAQAKAQQPNRLTNFLSAFKTRLIYAGSSALAVATLSLVLLVGGNSPSAFAQVQQHLSSVTNMFYQSKMIVQQQPIMTLSVWYQQPGLIRVETTPLTPQADEGKSINLINSVTGQGLLLFPGPKVSVPYQFEASQTPTPHENPLHWFQIAKDYQGEIIELERRFANGQWLNGFMLKESGYSIILWSTASDNLPVEFALFNGESAPASDFLMQGNLSFNQTFDNTLFSQTVPADYQQVSSDES